MDQLANAAAEHSLLAEQVGLGFLLEGGLQDACTAGTDAGSVCQGDLLCLAGVILLYADQGRAAFAFRVQAADNVAGALGSDHDNVNIFRGNNGLEMDVEAVCKSQCLALGHVGGNLAVVDVSAQFIGNQHHNNIAGLGSLFNFHHLKVFMGCSKLGCLFPVGRALAQADNNVHAAFSQVFGMGMALGAKADNSNGLAVKHAEVAVGIIILFDCHDNFSFVLFVWFVKIKTYLSSTRRRGFLKGLRAKCKFVEPQKLLYSSSCGQWVPGSGS